MRETADHYDSLIDENNDPYRDPPLLQEYMNKWDGDAFLNSMGLSQNKKVLEIGVGTGRLAARVAPRCLHLTGIDISPKTINRAKENLQGFPNITLICADFSDYSFHEKFDVIYSTLTMMHFENKQQFIFKVSHLLRPGGIFCLSIDQNQSDCIDMGTRKLKIFPDRPENIIACVHSAEMHIANQFETEFAHIFICQLNNRLC